nr:MAG TPA: hypothetical protein [Caudoviricetes sp.]
MFSHRNLLSLQVLSLYKNKTGIRAITLLSPSLYYFSKNSSIN